VRAPTSSRELPLGDLVRDRPDLVDVEPLRLAWRAGGTCANLDHLDRSNRAEAATPIVVERRWSPDKSSSRITLTSLCTFEDGVRGQTKLVTGLKARECRT
jgi:hypothetical protein